MTRFIFRNCLLIFTFLFLLGLAYQAPAWASDEHQTIPTVTPGGGGGVQLPDGLNSSPVTNSNNPNNSFTQRIVFILGGAVVVLGLTGGGLFIASWLGWLKFPK